MKLKLLDLFSGIGGFSLGLESTGFFETIAFVEKDKFCQKVLKKNFNNIPIEEDIRNVKGSNYKADVITGGFPCQPFSIAGKRKGTDDDRYLWDETIRVVKECKPRWFIGENVEGLVNINEGMVLRQVQNDLEREGFEVQCLIIPASGIGAWHQRKRIWIMAHSNSNRHSSKVKGSSGEKKRISQEYREIDSTYRKPIGTSPIWETGNSYVPNTSSQRHFIGENRNLEKESKKEKGTGNKSSFQTLSSCSDVPNTNISSKTKRREYENDEKTSSSREHFKGGSISYGGEGCVQSTWKSEDVQHPNNQRSQEFNISKESEKQNINNRQLDERENKTWWKTQSSLCGVPNGVSYELDKDRANRIKSLGNSIVPQIARQLGLAIMETEKNETR